ncbi:MAG: extracellular solute-binding protein [Clostridia bacterium]|nr:extracellular solute-binding protein [Clostridia bacterium]
MKRKLSILLLALVLLASRASAMAEVVYGDFPVVQEPGSCRTVDTVIDGKLNAICVDQGRVYLLEGGELWRSDDELNRLESLHRFEKELCGFSVSNGQFYYSYVEGDRTVFARLTADGQEERLFDTSAERSMFRMVVAEDAIVVMWQYSTYELQCVVNPNAEMDNICKITAYSLSGEQLAENLLDEVADIAYVPQYGLVMLRNPAPVPEGEPDCRLMAWDLQTHEVSPLEAYRCEGLNLAATLDGSAFYTGDNLQIFRHEKWDPPYQYEGVAKRVDPAWADALLVCTDTKLYCYRQHGDMKLQSVDLPGAGNGTGNAEGILHIAITDNVDSDPLLRVAKEHFEQRHPDVTVQFEPYQMEQMKTALMANEGDLDLIKINMSDLANFVQMGALYDLNGDAEMKQRMESWVGNGAFCMNGIRYGVPLRLTTDCMLENEALKQYAPQIDWENCTWLEVLEQAEQFETDINGDGIQDVWFMADYLYRPSWIMQYESSAADIRKLSFDTEAFRALAEQYRRCVQAGVLQDLYDWDQNPDGTLYAVDSLYALDGSDFLPLPSVEGTESVTSYTFALAVSRTTEHYDLAMEFLKDYTSEKVQAQSYEVGYGPDSEIYPAYAELTAAEKKQVEVQKAYINRAVPQWRNQEYDVHRAELMEKYLNDEITLDELVSSLQQKLQMVLWG